MGFFSKFHRKNSAVEQVEKSEKQSGTRASDAANKIVLKSSEFNINSVLNDVANALSMVSKKRGNSLNFEMNKNVPPKMTGDRLRLGKVLLNLLDNALAFTYKGEVKLTVERIGSEKDEVKLRFKVSDTGVGIHPEALEDLLLPFLNGKIHSLDAFGITGRGLLDAREIVNAMHGTISVISEQRKGSTFIVDVSFESEHMNEPRQYRLPSIKAVGLDVIIMDEDQNAADALKQLLEYFQHNVVTFVVPRLHEKSELPQFKKYAIAFVSDRLFTDQLAYQLLLAKSKHGLKFVLVENMYHEAKHDKKALELADKLVFKPFNQQMIFELLSSMYSEEESAAPTSETTNDHAGENRNRSVDNRQVQDADVLLIESDEHYQMNILKVLNQKSKSAVIAESSEEAEEILNAGHRFKLVLLDIVIAKKSTYPLLEKIKKESSANRHLPVIGMLPDNYAGEIKQVDEIGLEGYIQFPFRAIHLAKMLDKYLLEDEEMLLNEQERANLKKMDQIFVVKDGLMHAGNDKRFFHKVLDDFQSIYENSDSVFELFMQKEEKYQKAKKYAMELKSTLANIGAYRLSYIVSLMEQAFEKESYIDIEELVAMYAKEFPDTMETINHFKEYVIDETE